MTSKFDFERMRKAIKEKGLLDPKIVDKMSYNDMIEHLLRYSVLGEVWNPVVHNANYTK